MVNCKQRTRKSQHRNCLEQYGVAVITQKLPGKDEWRTIQKPNNLQTSAWWTWWKIAKKVPRNPDIEFVWKNAEWRTTQIHYRLQRSTYWTLWEISNKLPGKVNSWEQYRNHITCKQVPGELGGKLQRGCLGILTQKFPGKSEERRTIQKSYSLQTSAKWTWWKTQRGCLVILTLKLPGKVKSGGQYRNHITCKPASGGLGGKLQKKSARKSWYRNSLEKCGVMNNTETL